MLSQARSQRAHRPAAAPFSWCARNPQLTNSGIVNRYEVLAEVELCVGINIFHRVDAREWYALALARMEQLLRFPTRRPFPDKEIKRVAVRPRVRRSLNSSS